MDETITQKSLFEFFRTLKKKYKLSTCKIQYHNKNNSGGNFGYYLKGSDSISKYMTIHGEYNKQNEISTIHVELFYGSLKSIHPNDLKQLLHKYFSE